MQGSLFWRRRPGYNGIMSTLDEREQLIQQRQAEKYVNVIRMTLLGFLSVALLLRTSGLSLPFAQLGPAAPTIAAAWLYSLLVQAALSRGFFPKYLPWATTLIDFAFITLGFTLELSAGSFNTLSVSTSLSWGYALLFLVILFSALRERPELTLFNGVASTLLYSGSVAAFFPVEPFAGFWTDQAFRTVFLLLAGFFSGFHARSLRKAFLRVAASDRLRRETDARLKALALHFPGVMFQAEVRERGFRLRYISEGSRELLGVEPQVLPQKQGLPTSLEHSSRSSERRRCKRFSRRLQHTTRSLNSFVASVGSSTDG